MLNTEALKDYIRHVYYLESSLYKQERLLNQVNNEINIIRNQRPEPLCELEDTSKANDIWEDGWFPAFVKFFVFCSIVVFAIGMFVDNPSGDISEVIGWTFNKLLIGLITGIVLCLIVGGIKYNIQKNDIDQRNNRISLQNEQILSENKEMEIYNERKINILITELEKAKKFYNETKNVLNEYYSYDIIYKKYRNLPAVSAFHEYLTSKQCYELEGHEGAYVRYEFDLKMGTILSKLDEIIDKLDSIKENQRMLYDAIIEGNRVSNRIYNEIQRGTKKLERLENNQKLSIYYGKITAENTEYMKNLIIYNSMRIR